jgi:hypothetical protein
MHPGTVSTVCLAAAPSLYRVTAPVSVAVTMRGNVVVVCRGSPFVRLHSRHGQFLRVLGPLGRDLDPECDAPPTLVHPLCVVASPFDDRIFVLDAPSRRDSSGGAGSAAHGASGGAAAGGAGGDVGHGGAGAELDRIVVFSGEGDVLGVAAIPADIEPLCIGLGCPSIVPDVWARLVGA